MPNLKHKVKLIQKEDLEALVTALLDSAVHTLELLMTHDRRFKKNMERQPIYEKIQSTLESMMKLLTFFSVLVFFVPQSEAQVAGSSINNDATASTPQTEQSPASRVTNRSTHYAISVANYAAVGDAKTDDTAAFQTALQACAEQAGGIVEVPAGTYRIAGSLHIPADVALRGTFTSTPTGNPNQIMKGRMGSALLAYAGRGAPETKPFITLNGPNATIEGFVIYYPETDAATVPPVPYPPTVAVAVDRDRPVPIDNVAILNCLFLNSYDAIYLTWAGRHLIRNVSGYPIHRGIYVDQSRDVGRIENVHFWPFGLKYVKDDPYLQWINREAVAIELGRADWEIVSDCFSFGYGVGFKFSSSPVDGKSSCGKLIGCGADCAGTPLQFQASRYHWEISEGEFVGRWGGAGSNAVEIGPGVKGRISFSNCAFWGPIAQVVSMRAPAGIVALEGCQIENWNDDAGAIDVEAGRAILQGNSFDRNGRKHLIVGVKAGQVIATGNLASPHFDVRAAPGAKVILSANQ